MRTAITTIGVLAISSCFASSNNRPNILFAIADDISFPYMSAYKASGLKTPAFDEVAQRGILFNNGYVTSPGSSPSRASLLTGLYTWEVREGGTHGSYFPEGLITYTDILKEEGYHVGMTGKGWSPGNWREFREDNPAGKAYDIHECKPPFTGMHSYDYSKNFEAFLDARKEGDPFCFWYGGKEAHRGYEKDGWKRSDKQLSDAYVPPFLPDTPVIRGDILDYYLEVEWFDKHLGDMLRLLEERGELDNTLIVVTADNGMPFPSAKATCYDAGVHVPFAICWGDKIKAPKVCDEVVSTIDLAATFLDAAGSKNKQIEQMSSVSMVDWLQGKKGAKLPNRALSGREGHAYARKDGLGYPARSIRLGDWLYVHNFEPDREPAGDPKAIITKNGETKSVYSYADIDGSPSKGELLTVLDGKKPELAPYTEHAIAKRPEKMLYNLKEDRGCMVNLADNPKYAKRLKELEDELFRVLKEDKDPRLTNPEIWDSYPYFGNKARVFE